MHPHISYLVPSYHHARYLPQFLENLLLDIARLEVPAEVIIIDDGSPDESPSVISTWVAAHQDQCAIIYQRQENKGLTATLNALIDLATGTYLRLCASDDVILAGSTQMLYDQIRANPSLLCVLGNAEIIDEQGLTRHHDSITFHGGHPHKLKNPCLLTKELIQHWCVAGPCHLIKKSHYETMRYNETARIDDYDLFVSLLKTPNALLYIDEIVCLYRIHSTNTSKTQNVAQRIENIYSFLDIINKHLARDTFVKELLPVKYKTQAKIHFLKKQYAASGCHMFLSIFSQLKGWLC